MLSSGEWDAEGKKGNSGGRGAVKRERERERERERIFFNDALSDTTSV